MKQNRRSRRQEQAGAREFGGRVTPRSGAGDVKNDVRTDDFSIEYKYTDAKSYSMRFDMLEQKEKQALLDGGRDFLLIVEGHGREWVVMSKEVAMSRGINGHSE